MTAQSHTAKEALKVSTANAMAAALAFRALVALPVAPIPFTTTKDK